MQRARLEVRVGLELADVGDEEFDLLARQAAAQAFPVVDLVADLQARVALDQFRQRINLISVPAPGPQPVQFTGVELFNWVISWVRLAAPWTRLKACCSTTWPSGVGRSSLLQVDNFAGRSR